MSDVLTRILADKRVEVARRKAERPFSTLEGAARAAAPPRGFAAALSRAVATDGLALIAEIKRASPSKGLIREGFDPPALARAYRAGGAACLSVLTDGAYFQGSDADLEAAQAAVDLPCLRKDFMIDPYQIAEARALGADGVLIILAAVEDGLAGELAAAARAYGMDALVEVHDEAELDRAGRLDAALIGINNRDLKTLAVDLATTERLAPRAPAGAAIVCESGISRHADLARMARIGVRRFLVGSALMAAPDIAAATAVLLGRPPAARVSA